MKKQTYNLHFNLCIVYTCLGNNHHQVLIVKRLESQIIQQYLGASGSKHRHQTLYQYYSIKTMIRKNNQTHWQFLCPRDEGGGILIYPCPSVRPSRYRYMVCPAISSYSFGATAIIFCRMFIHIMEVCMSTGF